MYKHFYFVERPPPPPYPGNSDDMPRFVSCIFVILSCIKKLCVPKFQHFKVYQKNCWLFLKTKSLYCLCQHIFLHSYNYANGKIHLIKNAIKSILFIVLAFLLHLETRMILMEAIMKIIMLHHQFHQETLMVSLS